MKRRWTESQPKYTQQTDTEASLQLIEKGSRYCLGKRMQAYSFRAEYGNSLGYYLEQIPYCKWISTSSFEKWRLSNIPHKCVMRIKLREYVVFNALKYCTHFLEGIEEIIAISRGLRRWLEKEKAIHSSILAWKIPRTEEPDGLQSMGSQVGHDCATKLSEADTMKRGQHLEGKELLFNHILASISSVTLENYLASLSLSFLNWNMGTIYTLY